jgi:hypothetical protein
VNALLGGLAMAAWHLRGVRAHEAEQRRWARQLARCRAQDRVWSQPWEARRRRLREGSAR